MKDRDGRLKRICAAYSSACHSGIGCTPGRYAELFRSRSGEKFVSGQEGRIAAHESLGAQSKG